MHVWNVLHAARWKYRRKNDAKMPSGHHRTTLSGCVFATKARIDNGKKLVKQRYLLHMSAQYAELRPTNGWDRLAGLGTQANFNGFRVLASLLQRRRSAEANQTLNDVWPSPGLVDCLYIFGGLLPRNRILPGAKFTLRPPSLALSYIGSVTARHSNSGRESNFVTLSRRCRLYSAGRPSRWAVARILVL